MIGKSTVTMLEVLLPKLAISAPLKVGSPRSLYASIGTPSIRQNHDILNGQVYQLTAGLRIRSCLSEKEIAALYSQLRAQAINQDPDALNDLGWMWMTGTQVASNQALARRVLELAVAAGSAEAVFNLAERAYYGKGGTVDVPQAVERYTSILKHGKVNALRAAAACALARIDEAGELNGEPDPEAAIAWYDCAISFGDKSAVIEQSKLRLDVCSPCQDVAAAIYALQEAALGGLLEASYFLADLYAGKIPDAEYPIDPEGRMQGFWRELGDEQSALATGVYD